MDHNTPTQKQLDQKFVPSSLRQKNENAGEQLLFKQQQQQKEQQQEQTEKGVGCPTINKDMNRDDELDIFTQVEFHKRLFYRHRLSNQNTTEKYLHLINRKTWALFLPNDEKKLFSKYHTAYDEDEGCCFTSIGKETSCFCCSQEQLYCCDAFAFTLFSPCCYFRRSIPGITYPLALLCYPIDLFICQRLLGITLMSFDQAWCCNCECFSPKMDPLTSNAHYISGLTSETIGLILDLDYFDCDFQSMIVVHAEYGAMAGLEYFEIRGQVEKYYESNLEDLKILTEYLEKYCPSLKLVKGLENTQEIKDFNEKLLKRQQNMKKKAEFTAYLSNLVGRDVNVDGFIQQGFDNSNKLGRGTTDDFVECGLVQHEAKILYTLLQNPEQARLDAQRVDEMKIYLERIGYSHLFDSLLKSGCDSLSKLKEENIDMFIGCGMNRYDARTFYQELHADDVPFASIVSD